MEIMVIGQFECFKHAQCKTNNTSNQSGDIEAGGQGETMNTKWKFWQWIQNGNFKIVSTE